MKRTLITLLAGAALMYYLDSENGPQRRERARVWLQQNFNEDTWRQAREITTNQTQKLTQQINSLRASVSSATGHDNATTASVNNATRTPANV
jgi:hypothetical protein